MIIVTGAAGFIGSCMVNKLNNKGLKDLVLVDDFQRPEKARNLEKKVFREKVDRDVFFDWLDRNHHDVEHVLHLGARTDTTEFDHRVFDRLNLKYSRRVWESCSRYSIPLIYASSAATYGLGEQGYSDDHSLIPALKPLNPYGTSKQQFDMWVLQQSEQPPSWTGLKFFNVYGPNEYHKGRMASVVFHAYGQVARDGKVRLFKSHRPDYQDGMQLRDFIYVRDVTDVIYFLMKEKKTHGIMNLGTGKARTFLDLAVAVFEASGKTPVIEYIDTPADIRNTYQYYTQAAMDKLAGAGYVLPFYSLEAGVNEYVLEFLSSDRCF